MTRTDIAKELRRYTGKGLVTNTELAAFLGDKNTHRVKVRYLLGLERIGRGYLISEVAERLKEHCVLGGEEDEEDYCSEEEERTDRVAS